MTFLEALYGSQYEEIQQRGGDGSKARFNGNLLLSVMVLLWIIAVLLAAIKGVPCFDEQLTRFIRSIFGYSSGKTIGRLLALPALFLIYWVVQRTTGSEQQFKLKVDAFSAYPEATRKQGNRKILIPFFVLLGFVILLVLL